MQGLSKCSQVLPTHNEAAINSSTQADVAAPSLPACYLKDSGLMSHPHPQACSPHSGGQLSSPWYMDDKVDTQKDKN